MSHDLSKKFVLTLITLFTALALPPVARAVDLHEEESLDADAPLSWKCAPEVKAATLKALSRNLNELSRKDGLKDNEVFVATVQRISAIKDQKTQFGEYLKLVGLQKASAKEILNFIGAREVDSSAVKHLQDSMGINSAQADEMVRVLTAQLKGTIR